MNRIYALFIFIALSIASYAQEQLRFASVFTDNMVLQHNQNVNIWGYANPEEKLVLACSWAEITKIVTANKDGKWAISIATPKADLKPHTIQISSKKENKMLSNILLGEVWLCSGQSNMEMRLGNQPQWNLIVENSEHEIATATNSNIRFVNLQRKESFEPIDDANVEGWKEATAQHVRWLSAVGYFFAKNVTEKTGIPIGLIVSSYGGSPIQSWIPQPLIDSKPIYKKEKEIRAKELEASHRSEIEYAEAMRQWVADSQAKTKDNNYGKPQELTLPINLEKASVGNQMGEVSFSKDIVLTNTDKDITISLGTIDDLGRVYFNGEMLWQELRNSRSYSKPTITISKEKIKNGINKLEVRVFNILWGGGLTGPADEMYYTSNGEDKVSLAGNWVYRKIFDVADADPMPLEGKATFQTASSLYNGMIYPLRDYTLKGFLWYQGEANLDDADTYAEMQADMLASWRKSFGADCPFYYVQIAPYQYGTESEFKSHGLKDAQVKAKELMPHSGMVSTLDLGDASNIHPAKKREVGERLANIALCETYNNKSYCNKNNYPYIQSILLNRETVLLTLANSVDGIAIKADKHEMELSHDGETFYPADIKQQGTNTLIVTSPKVASPMYIRYCWRDGAVGTITNSKGLPLSYFLKKLK